MSEAWDWPEVVCIRSTRPDILAGTNPFFEPQWDGPSLVGWNEGNHVRLFPVGEILESTGERFKFRDTYGQTHELLPMTLELYEKHVRQHTIGKNTYATLAELLAAMRREW